MAGGYPEGGLFALASLLLVGFSAAKGCSVSWWLTPGDAAAVGDFAEGFALNSVTNKKSQDRLKRQRSGKTETTWSHRPLSTS